MDQATTRKIKRSINRLVEPHRVRDLKKSKAPKQRPAVTGTVGAAERITRIEP